MYGGIVGGCYDKSGNVSISQCYNKNAVSLSPASDETYRHIGGILGAAERGTVTINNCYNTGTVNGHSRVGGIVGLADAITSPLSFSVSNSYNIGTISGSKLCGGIVGFKYNESGGTFTAYSTTNTYYLNTCGGGNSYGGTSKTAAQLKNLALTLGSAFKDDKTPNINSGYPLLTWQ